VTLSDDTTLQAKVIGRDSVTDLALLKVKPKAPLPAASHVTEVLSVDSG
jgi:serine protease Do